MTATDLHAEALALIAERRALLAAGTPGPWEDGNGHLLAPLHTESRIALRIASIFPSGNGPKPNTPLIAAAVNDYGPLLDLAEAVLLRHAPEGTEPTGRLACEWCSDAFLAPWPCDDAAAALRSLGLVTP